MDVVLYNGSVKLTKQVSLIFDRGTFLDGGILLTCHVNFPFKRMCGMLKKYLLHAMSQFINSHPG